MAGIKKTRASLLGRLRRGAVIYRDFIKGTKTVRVTNGSLLLCYPIEVFEQLKKSGHITLKKMCSFHVEYKLTSKRDRNKKPINMY